MGVCKKKNATASRDVPFAKGTSAVCSPARPDQAWRSVQPCKNPTYKLGKGWHRLLGGTLDGRMPSPHCGIFASHPSRPGLISLFPFFLGQLSWTPYSPTKATRNDDRMQAQNGAARHSVGALPYCSAGQIHRPYYISVAVQSASSMPESRGASEMKARQDPNRRDTVRKVCICLTWRRPLMAPSATSAACPLLAPLEHDFLPLHETARPTRTTSCCCSREKEKKKGGTDVIRGSVEGARPPGHPSPPSCSGIMPST